MNAERRVVNIFVCFHVGEQIHTELIQAQVHDGDTVCHVFQINDFFLQLLELAATIFKVAFFFLVDKIIITSRSHDGNTHSRFNSGFKVDVFVEIQIRPEVHKLYHSILTADTINSSEALNDTHWVPVDIVVYAIIAVLQVLTF